MINFDEPNQARALRTIRAPVDVTPRMTDEARAAADDRRLAKARRLQSIVMSICMLCTVFSIVYMVYQFPVTKKVHAAQHQRAPRSNDNSDAATQQRRDPIAATLGAVSEGRFDSLGDVATGRFLRDYSGREMPSWLARISPEDLRHCRRGRGWLLAKVTFGAGDLNQSRPGRAQLRFVETDGVWKLEDIRMVENVPRLAPAKN